MKKIFAFTFISLGFLGILTNYYLINDVAQEKIFSFITVLVFVIGIFLSIPFHQIPNFIFDPREWEQNKTIESIVFKLRIRAVLFNNISIAIFFVILIVIFSGFYFLINPPLQQETEKTILSTNLTVRIGSSVLLIFLVGILFRVFKYLLRVAAFYNSKADALEFHELEPEIELEKLMELFTPEKYDISELEQSSIASNIIDMIKAKLK